MVARKSKARPVKWAIGADEPDDLGEFRPNSEIGLPPKGIYHFWVKKVTRSLNKNDDEMLTLVCEIKEPGKSNGAKYNGYTCWERLNVTEQGGPFLKRWLKAMGLEWSDFIGKSVVDETTDPETIVSIGNVKFGATKPIVVRAATRHREYLGEDQLDIARFLEPADSTPIEDDEAEEDDDVDEDIELEEDEAEEAEEDEAEEELREELGSLTLVRLKKRALAAGADDDLPKRKVDIIDLIVELELGVEDEDEEEPEDEEPEEVDEDELREELEELGLPDLRARAKAIGAKLNDVKGKRKPALIDLIVSIELEGPPF